MSTHRKTIKAARLLKCDKHKLIGHLHELWWWGLDNADDVGLLAGIERYDLSLAAQWKGDAEAFAVVLIESGFVDVHPTTGRLFLHDWWDYAGKLNTQRDLRKQSNRARQQRHRSKPVTGDEGVTNAVVTRDTPVTPCDSNQSTVPTVPTNLTSTPPTPSGQEGGEGVCVDGDQADELWGGEGKRRLPVLQDAVAKTAHEGAFAAFWEAFAKVNPKPGDKTAAGKAWNEHVPPGDEPAVLASMANYAVSDRVKRGAIMNANTFLGVWRQWQEPENAKGDADLPPGQHRAPDGTVWTQAGARRPDGKIQVAV